MCDTRLEGGASLCTKKFYEGVFTKLLNQHLSSLPARITPIAFQGTTQTATTPKSMLFIL